MHYVTGFDFHSLANEYNITVDFSKSYHEQLRELYIAVHDLGKPFDAYLTQVGQRILAEIFNYHSDVFVKLESEKGSQYFMINGKRHSTLYSYFANDALYGKDIEYGIGCIKDGKILVNYRLNQNGVVEYIFV